MQVYGGIDLHASNNYIGIVDEKGRKIHSLRLPNKLEKITATLEPFKSKMAGVVVESTFNWYWLVDALMEKGYKVYLANPCAIKQYKGLKYSNDKNDAFFLAKMLQLNILPVGYIYPKEKRHIRDLLRVRSILVKKRTALIVSLSGIIARNTGLKVKATVIKSAAFTDMLTSLNFNDNLLLSAYALKEAVDCLTSKIKEIETKVLKEASLKLSYNCLKTLPGVGTVLALTTMLETGPIKRVKKAGNYVSYCRKVSSKYLSSDKYKGKGNVKNGNRYLAWAYGEAAEYARRFNEQAKAYFNRKCAKTNKAVAHAALAHKLARAAYYMMKNNEPFDHKRVFN
jgi:transposase